MTPNRLPGADCALVERKRVEGYLLDIGHGRGGSKAKFFLGRGFSALLWQEFADALVAHGRNNSVTRVTETEWGIRYRVDCNCPMPDGANHCIRTVWEIGIGGQCPRLLTAHPL